MRRLVAIALVLALVLPFVETRGSRAATVVSSWPVGAQPFGLALDEQTGKIYVANSYPYLGPGRISVVDPRTDSVGTLQTSLTPNVLVVDSPGRRLYSSNGNLDARTRSLDVFDLDSGALLATIPVGGFGMALDRQAGRLYVCESGSLKVIDTNTLAVLASATAPASTWWFSAAVDAERHHLYVTNIRETSPTLFVLDDRDLSTIAEIPVTIATRFALTIDPVSRQVLIAGGQWVTQPTTGQFTLVAAISVIDPDALTVVHTTPLPAIVTGIALAPSRHRIYVSDSTGWRLTALDDATYALLETVRTSFPPGELLMHPDGRLYVGAYDGISRLDSTLVAVDLENHAPVFQSLTVSPATVYTGDTLRADAFAVDPDFSASLGGDPVTYTYEWSRNGIPIPGATSSTLDLSIAGNGDRGDTISVRVTASDGQLSSDASTSVVVRDSPPTASVNLGNAAPATNAVLSATAIATDADNDPISYRFVWRVNGVVRRTASGANASDSFDLGMAGNGDHGDGVVVELVASDGALDSAAASAGATVVNSAPTVSVSLNTTAPAPKSVLVATVLGQDVDSDRLTYVYTWRLNGVVKRTVTTTSTTDRYDISVKGNGKKGDVVVVTVTASDGTLTSPAASLSATIR